METILYPNSDGWKELSKRPLASQEDLDATVTQIFDAVIADKDAALFRFISLYDQVLLDQILVNETEISFAESSLPTALKQAIYLAYSNIAKFHLSQREHVNVVETSPEVFCWRESRAIEKVGLYIPGGTAPLFSTVLMLGIPAKIAGCTDIVLCTPPQKDGKINAAILYAAKLVGVTKIFKIGGAQAIAALSIGTPSIPKVDKIFGPGNQFVMAAKQKAMKYGVAIDLPAGPSELLIIADQTSIPEFVAADLLSQAEHGPDSQVILLSDTIEAINNVLAALEKQLADLPRKDIMQAVIRNSKAILLNNLDACISFSNVYAPEHLILVIENSDKWINKVQNAGSVFLGNYSCESAGDYASGTNHTLPTNGFAKNYSGVSLDSFVKKITFQKISKEGLKLIGPAIEIMAAEEQLMAHKNAVSIRLKEVDNV